MLNLSFLLQTGLVPNIIAKSVYTALSMAVENYTAPRVPPENEVVKEHFDLLYSKDLINTNQIYLLILMFFVRAQGGMTTWTSRHLDVWSD